MPNGYTAVTWLLSGPLRMGRIIDQEASMKLSLLISTAVAIVIAAVAMSSSASGSSGARKVPGFRSPSGNIHCYFDRKAIVPANGTKRLLTCGLQHADYAYQKKYYPSVKEAERKKEIDASNVALLEDRILMREGKKQIYGTQLTWNEKTGRPNCEEMYRDTSSHSRKPQG